MSNPIIPPVDPARAEAELIARAKAQQLINIANERDQREGHALGLGLGKFSNDSQENA